MSANLNWSFYPLRFSNSRGAISMLNLGGDDVLLEAREFCGPSSMRVFQKRVSVGSAEYIAFGATIEDAILWEARQR